MSEGVTNQTDGHRPALFERQNRRLLPQEIPSEKVAHEQSTCQPRGLAASIASVTTTALRVEPLFPRIRPVLETIYDDRLVDAILCGSFATDKPTEDSDTDVAVLLKWRLHKAQEIDGCGTRPLILCEAVWKARDNRIRARAGDRPVLQCRTRWCSIGAKLVATQGIF